MGTAANMVNQQNVIGNGQQIQNINSGYAQSVGLPQMNSSAVGPPPMVPIDANPRFNNLARPLPDVVPAGPYGSQLGQLPNPYANNNNGFGQQQPPPQFGGPPHFNGFQGRPPPPSTH